MSRFQVRAGKLGGEAHPGKGALGKLVGPASRDIGRGPVGAEGGGAIRNSRPRRVHLPWVGKLIPKKKLVV